MITVKTLGSLQWPLMRRLATSPLFRANSNAVTPPSDGGEKTPDVIKPKSKDHFAASQSKPRSDEQKSDAQLVMDQVQAAMPHPIWSQDQLTSVKVVHRPASRLADRLALYTVKFFRFSFDLLSGYRLKKAWGTLDEKSVLTRVIFLETVAGVPGFAGGMIRHLHSLRRMEKDQGWIHTLLEEAENERMHLMIFLELRHPGKFFRLAVLATQWVFTFGFSLSYLLSPALCHRFVGYLEEEAVFTYTDIISLLDKGKLPMWKSLPAPALAVNYYRLGPQATMRDVLMAVRADEDNHRLVNHTLGDIDSADTNPFQKTH